MRRLRSRTGMAWLSSSGPVQKPLVPIFLIALVIVVLPSILFGQSKPASKSRRSAVPAKTVSRTELDTRVKALESAKQSGDADSISAAAKMVLATGLREMGCLQLLQGGASHAIDTYRRSNDFEDSVITRINLSLASLQADRFDDSLRLLTDILMADPKNVRAWYVHGQLWIAKERYEEAVTSFKHVLDLQDDPAATYLLGASLLQLKHYDDAEVVFARFTGTTQKNIHLLLADAYRAGGYMDDFARELRAGGPAPARASATMATIVHNAALFGSSLEIFSSTPTDQVQAKRAQDELRTLLANTLNDLGTAEAKQGQFQLAMAHFHEAATWKPDLPGLMRNTGIAACRVPDYPECIRVLRAVVFENPRDTIARSMLGTALFATQAYAEAAKVFTPLGDSALQVPELAYSWAATLVRINKFSEATDLLNKLEREKLSTETLMLIAQLWSQMGNHEHTVAVCHRALQMDPRLPKAHYIAGQALLRLNRSAEAATEFRGELQLDPNNIDAQFSLAYSLLQQSQTAEAIELLQTVVASKPDHPEANYELGKQLLMDGKPAEAISYLEAAVRLKPQFEPAHFQLQAAYRAVGRKEDADREVKIFRALKEKGRNITFPPKQTDADASARPD